MLKQANHYFTLFILFVTSIYLFNGCFQWKVANTFFEHKIGDKVRMSEKKYILSVNFDDYNSEIWVQLMQQLGKKQMKRKVTKYKKNLSFLEENPIRNILASLGFVAMGAYFGNIGKGLLLGVSYIFVTASRGAKGHEKTKKVVGDWYSTDKIIYTGNEPATNELISIQDISSDKNNFRIADEVIRTNAQGIARTKVKIINDFLIDKTSPLWKTNIFSSSPEIFFDILIRHNNSYAKKILKIGPFKNIETELLNLVASEIKFNVIDINSHFPLQNTRVKCKIPNKELLKNRINKILPKNNNLLEIIIDKFDENLAKTYVTNSNGEVAIPLIKGVRYNFEFSNKDYYWYKTEILVSEKFNTFDILLSDIGSKVRKENVVPKTEVIKSNY